MQWIKVSEHCIYYNLHYVLQLQQPTPCTLHLHHLPNGTKWVQNPNWRQHWDSIQSVIHVLEILTYFLRCTVALVRYKVKMFKNKLNRSHIAHADVFNPLDFCMYWIQIFVISRNSEWIFYFGISKLFLTSYLIQIAWRFDAIQLHFEHAWNNVMISSGAITDLLESLWKLETDWKWSTRNSDKHFIMCNQNQLWHRHCNLWWFIIVIWPFLM